MLGSGKAESYQSQITPNFNQPQQIYSKTKATHENILDIVKV